MNTINVVLTPKKHFPGRKGLTACLSFDWIEDPGKFCCGKELVLD